MSQTLRMLVIRKFVGYTGAAAGVGAAIALAMSAQTGIAAAPTTPVEQSTVTTFTPSVACTAAINAIKAWVRTDAAEDNTERQAIRTDPTAGDPDNDAAERSTVQGLFTAARAACAPTAGTAPKFTTFTPSAQCSAAIQALKAAFAQGRPPTQAQFLNLQTLGVAVRSACGWSWRR